MRFILMMLIAIALAACSSQDESETPRPADEPAREGLRGLAGDPETMQKPMGDPERRQAVRERLEALRQEEGKGHDRRPDRRAAMRERAGVSRQSRSSAEGQSTQKADGGERRRRGRSAQWWQDEAIASDIGLSEQQVASIGSAHAKIMRTARKSRQELADAAAAMREALKSGDRERLNELVDMRVEALAGRARAEAEWMRQLLEILSDEQMRKLVEERPQLVSALLAPLRG